jgi:aconitate hydratase
VAPKDFNSYGARRGNHEVMMRGTFANTRIRNKMTPEIEGGFTVHLPDGEPLSIYDAAMKYQAEGIPTVIFAGKEYGTGSSRDWAAKGPRLQGVRAVIAESFERIHRSNLVGMGIAPLELMDGQSVASLGLTGYEIVDITGLAEGVESGFRNGREVTVRATKDDGKTSRVIEFKARVRLDTPQEVQYYRHGGILHYVLRQLVMS